MKLRYHPLAFDEMRVAIQYYEEQRPGLGHGFLLAIEATVERILQFPNSGLPDEYGLRRLLLRGFPFTVLYAVDDDVCRVIAVMHDHRRPGYWKSRIPHGN